MVDEDGDPPDLDQRDEWVRPRLAVLSSWQDLTGNGGTGLDGGDAATS